MATPVKVKKWGSSMVVPIPSRFAKMHDINVGMVIDLESVRFGKNAADDTNSQSLWLNSNLSIGMGNGTSILLPAGDSDSSGSRILIGDTNPVRLPPPSPRRCGVGGFGGGGI